MTWRRARTAAITVAVVVAVAATLTGCAVATTATISAAPGVVTAGQVVTLTARVTSTTVPTGSVAFVEGFTVIGSAPLSSGKAVLKTSTLSIGVHQITARYGAQGVWAGSLSSAVTVTVQADPSRYQVSLGDSLGTGTGAPAGQGYVDDILAHEQTRIPGLKAKNLSCGGATTASLLNGGGCTYAEGSQLAAAEAFLRAHPGKIAYVTIDIGANDVTGCFGGGTIDQACLQTQSTIVATNLTTILSRLRAAAGSAPIIAMNYYNPFLAYWTFGNQAAAQQSQLAVAAGNASSAQVFATAGVPVADVAGAFDSANFALTGTYNGQSVPQNVANICAWTHMCASADIHANATGHQLIATTFQPLIDARVS